MSELTEEKRQAIYAAIYEGRKIEAIKLYREVTGGQLVDAKQAIEEIEQDLRQREPGKFVKPAGKSGCRSLAAVVALLASAALVTIYILRS